MNIIESMNYRFENPTIDIPVDSLIVDKFMSRDRSMSQVENCIDWVSMSKEGLNIEPLYNYKQNIQTSEYVR